MFNFIHQINNKTGKCTKLHRRGLSSKEAKGHPLLNKGPSRLPKAMRRGVVPSCRTSSCRMAKSTDFAQVAER